MFIGADGLRRTIRLGKVTAKQAGTVKSKVEQLVASGITGHPPDDETSRWLNALEDPTHDRLSAVGLVPQRQSQHLGPWLDSFLSEKGAELKPGSVRKLAQTKEKLLGFYSPSLPLRAITHESAAEWRRWMVDSGLSEASVKIHCGNAKTMFLEASRRKLIPESPMARPRSGATARLVDRYVTPDEIDRVVNTCPGVQWKLLFGLARYAGLRISSESHSLVWSDVDFERHRLHVRSVKTERHRGHERRMVPAGPKLMKLLQDAYTESPDGADRVVTINASGYMAEKCVALVRAAGVEPWPDLFQTLRASCEKEWAMTFPQFAVSRWIGHSITVSGRHYANSVPDELFERVANAGAKAAHNQAQQAAETAGNEPQRDRASGGRNRVTPHALATCGTAAAGWGSGR